VSGIDLSTLEARKALAAKYGAKHGISAALVAAVIEQESSWDTWAMRYEPAFYERYIVPMNLEDRTAAFARATSFGLMQLMGQTAIEFGFKGKYASSLCDPDLGVDFGCAKLRSCLDKNGGDLTKSLLSYNGGGNTFYPAQVLARLPTYE
jgi:soluble lytic murein transglycosylase-like protein